MQKLFIDTEIRLSGDIAHGPHKAAGAGSMLLCIAWQLGSSAPQTWQIGEDSPKDLLLHLADPEIEIVAHNAPFDSVVLERFLKGCPAITTSRLNCTAARCADFGIPAGLDAALDALKAPEEFRKDTFGRELMMSFTVGTNKGRAKGRRGPPLDPFQNSEDFERVVSYCAQDIKGLVWLDANVPELSKFERSVWIAHADINSRGIFIDTKLAAACAKLGAEYLEHVDADFLTLTGVSPRSHVKVRAWFTQRLPEAVHATLPDSMDRSSLALWRKEFEGDSIALQALHLKRQASTDAGARFQKFIDQAGDDGRVRDLFRYSATVTRRWASGSDSESKGGSNIQNLNRGVFGPEAANTIRAGILAGFDYDDLSLISDGDVHGAITSVLRNIFIPAPGLKFCDYDFSKIEPIAAASLSGFTERLEMIQKGVDLYKVAAATIFGTTTDKVTKTQRQVGKVAELLCIAAGTPVLTHRGEVPIELVKASDLLWDGIEWVSHGGLVDKGIKEVMTYDGLTATPDHLVFIEGHETPIELREAAKRGVSLKRCGHAAHKDAEPQNDNMREARVFDILNAGPRNRFTASGRLVHNCGYGGGAQTLLNNLIESQIPGADLKLAERAVTGWRRANQPIVKLWYELVSKLAECAVTGKDQPFAAGRGIFVKEPSGVRMQLPGGGSLWYKNPRCARRYDGSWEVTCDRPRGGSMQASRADIKVLTENFVSGSARDVLADSLIRAHAAGLKVVGHFHDQILVEGTQEDAAQLKQIMEAMPAWAADWKVRADGGVNEFFTKD